MRRSSVVIGGAYKGFLLHTQAHCLTTLLLVLSLEAYSVFEFVTSGHRHVSSFTIYSSRRPVTRPFFLEPHTMPRGQPGPPEVNARTIGTTQGG
jgi:hypothetical protein